MNELEKQLQDFQNAILQRNAAPVLPQIKTNPRLSAAQQMHIYIDGYRIRLLAAVASDYPALIAHLGKDIFDAAALAYIEANPSTSYNLDIYPHAFAPYFCARSDDVFANELATLEAAIAEVFMAEESAPLNPETFAQLAPEALGEAMLAPRRASRLLAFSYPVSAWLDAQRETKAAPPAPAAQEHFLFVYRHENSVRREALSRAGYVLLEALGNAPVGEALEQVATHHPQHMQEIAENLQSWFAQWVQNGFFRA